MVMMKKGVLPKSPNLGFSYNVFWRADYENDIENWWLIDFQGKNHKNP